MGLILETAVTLSFLMAGFNYLRETKDKDGILEPLPVAGEDVFTYDCYDIAEAIEILNMDVARDRDCPGVYHYEAIEDIAAKVLFDYIDNRGTMPVVLEFIERFKPMLEKWYEASEICPVEQLISEALTKE